MSNSNTLLPQIPADIAPTYAFSKMEHYPSLILILKLFGIVINFMLFGVLSIQTYVYHLNFPDDKFQNKALVYGIYISEVVQTAMTGADLYFWYGSGFGNLDHLSNVNLTPFDTPIICGLVAAVVQCFFAYRIYTLRKSYIWICVLIILTSIIQTVGAMGVGYRAFKLQQFPRFHEHVLFPQSFDVWLIGDTICDILIAGTMLWIFQKTLAEGGNHGTRILGKLVRIIVETNTLTAGMALVSFILYVTLPASSLFVCTTLIMGKLYSNTLLVTFNNRIAMRNMSYQSQYSSRSSERMPVKAPSRHGISQSNSEANMFRLASNGFAVQPENTEGMEKEKGRQLMSIDVPV